MGIKEIENLAYKKELKREEVRKFLTHLKKIPTSQLEWKIEEINIQLQGLIDKLNRDTINISIVSEVSSGKSTFLNALVFSEPILESRLGETTAKIFKIKYGEKFSIDGKVKSSLRELKEEISRANQKAIEKSNETKRIQDKLSVISLPNTHLKKGIELYDTPGFATINEKSMLDIIKQSISQSDATILLLDISQGVKESERLFIKNILYNINPTKRFIVLNKYDSIFSEDDLLLKSKEEIDKEIKNLIESVNKTLKHLQKESDAPIITYHLSAKKALVAKFTENKEKLKESRFTEFEDSFWSKMVLAKDGLFEEHTQLFIELKEETKKALLLEQERLRTRKTEVKKKLYELIVQERNLKEVINNLSKLTDSNKISVEKETLLKKSQQEIFNEMISLLNINLKGELSDLSVWHKLSFWKLKQLYHFSIQTVINQAESYLIHKIKMFIKKGTTTQNKQEEKKELILKINYYLQLSFFPDSSFNLDTTSIINHTLYRMKQELPWSRNILFALLKTPYYHNTLLDLNGSELNKSMELLQKKMTSSLLEEQKKIQAYIKEAYQKIDTLENNFNQTTSLKEEFESLSEIIENIESFLSNEIFR